MELRSMRRAFEPRSLKRFGLTALRLTRHARTAFTRRRALTRSFVLCGTLHALYGSSRATRFGVQRLSIHTMLSRMGYGSIIGHVRVVPVSRGYYPYRWYR